MLRGEGIRNHAYVWMDVLRLVAAVEVVLYHVIHCGLREGRLAVADPVLRGVLWHVSAYGQEAVEVFFVLSGFWIASAVDRLRDSDRFWTEYLVRRLSRLMIVLVPALLIGGAMDIVGAWVLKAPVYFDESGASWGGWPPMGASLKLTVLVANLLFIPDAFVARLGSNAALWSLSCEFWFYLAWPALVMLARRRASLALAAVAFVAVQPAMLETFAVWLAGVAVYYLHRRQPARLRGAVWLPGAALAGLAAAMVLSRFGTLSRFGPVGEKGATLLLALATAGLLMALVRAAPAPGVLARRAAAMGAAGTYSLYLAHMPLAVLLGALAQHAGWPDSIALRLMIVPVVLGWGWLFATLFEARTPALREAVLSRLAAGRERLRTPQARPAMESGLPG